MRRQFLIILLFSYCISAVAQKGPGEIDVLHYKFNIELNDQDDHLAGQAAITFISTTNTPGIEFDLDKADKRGMIVTKVLLESQADRSLSYSHTNSQLGIKANFKKGDTSTVIIFYDGIPADGLIISKNKFGKRTFFADNWPNRAHYWIPCNDNPADKATFEFLITAPSHYKVISNGILQEEKDLPDNKKLTYWKEVIPLSTKIMVIGVADFAVDNIDTVNGIPVSSWVFKENKTDGFKDYSIGSNILQFFMDYIGPYPYKKLANVQSKTIFGGMENAGAIFYSENSVNGRQDKESLFAHEIVHQWFGDMATEKNFAHLWLSEGFATYLTHIYIESKYGTDSLDKEMEKDRREIIAFAKNNRHPIVDSVSDYMELLNTNSYQKGSWVLHMLRRQLGDTVFHQCIRKYYATYAGKNADTRDLEKIVEEVSSKDLSVFFQQWLYTPGLPKLEIKWEYAEKNKMATITVKQLQKETFQFPLELLISFSSGEPQQETIQVSKESQSFSIPVKEKPLLIMPDPGVSLLFEGTTTEKK